jgi:hypothetical protein
LDRYQKELSKITQATNIPSDWASPDQRCRAAIQANGTVWPGHSFEQKSQTITSPISWILERISPSLHAVIKDLLFVASASKGGLTFALIQVAVVAALTLGFVRSWGLLASASRQKRCANE